jgi:hypothetical protein
MFIFIFVFIFMFMFYLLANAADRPKIEWLRGGVSLMELGEGFRAPYYDYVSLCPPNNFSLDYDFVRVSISLLVRAS